MKKLLATLLAATMLVGCGGGSAAGTSGTTSGSTDSGSAASSTAAAAPETTEAPKSEGKKEGTATTERVDRVVVAINSASTDASPYAMNTPSRGQTKEALYATLFYVRPLHFIDEVQPYIGKSITQVDDYTWDIELFDYVYDSKGNHITAEDVLWSYEYSFKNQEFLVYGTDVESFEIIDDYHMRLKTTKTIPGVIEKLVCNNPLTIVDKEWFESASDEEKQMNPATTGRYVVEKNISGSEIVLKANDDYWQKDESLLPEIAKANVDRIDLKVITEDSMRAIALENKEIDVARINANNLHRFYDLETGQAKEGYNVFVGMAMSPGGVSAYCNMDPDGPSVLAHDVNLRKAALYSLSTEDFLLASGNTFATAEVSKGFGSTYSEGYQEKWNDPSWDYFNYDIDKAKEFYKESGHAPGEVTIKVLMSISLFSDSQQAVVLAGLEEAGFKVDLLAVDQALFLNYRFENDVWDIIFDYKGSGDHIVTGWDNLFNPVGYSNGSVCFTKDDHLVELLKNAVEDSSDENINAFNDYLIDQAICKYTYTAMSISVAQDGILEQFMGNNAFSGMGSTYSTEYKSAVGAKN